MNVHLGIIITSVLLLATIAATDYAIGFDIYKNENPTTGATEYSDAEQAKPGAKLHIRIEDSKYEPVLIVRERPADDVYGTTDRRPHVFVFGDERRELRGQ